MNKDKKLKEIIAILGKISKMLKIVKRKDPSKMNLLSNDDLKDYAAKALVNSFFHKYFQTKVAITHGEVFVVNMDFECGNELSGRHFVVAMNDSKEQDPMVTVIPLKSYKGVLNPRSDVLLGKVEGTTTGSESIALINQIKSIDKCRLFEHTTIMQMKRILNSAQLAEDSEIEINSKTVYRLSEQQFRKLQKAMNEFLNFGYIQH